MAAATATANSPWQPREEGLMEICGLLEHQISPSSTSDKSQIMQQLQHYSLFPDFNNYLVFILSRADGKSAEIRQVAGSLLKNNLRSSFNSMSPANQNYIKSELLPCLGSPDRSIRSTAGMIVSVIVQLGGVVGWPELVHAIGTCRDSNDLNHMERAMDALSKICEDVPQLLDSDVPSMNERPINLLLPRLFKAEGMVGGIVAVPDPHPPTANEEEEEIEVKAQLGSFNGMVTTVEVPSEETMLLWGLQQPTHSKPNAFARQSSLSLRLDSCGHSLSISQSPSSLGTPGVTGSVMWDSGIVLGKFLEHAVDSGLLVLQGKKVVELGSGCGLVGCIAALLGSQVILTDLPDRLRLLKKNVDSNLDSINIRGSAIVREMIWGEDPFPEVVEPVPDYVLGSDVVYSEGAVGDLLATLCELCGTHTTVFLAGELRNDAILELFLEAALKDFVIGRVEQADWHPDYQSRRVVLYVLVKR